MVMFAKLLSITEGLHRYLQSESLDLGKAFQFKTAVLETLRELRTDTDTAEDVFRTAMDLCEAQDIQPPAGPRQKHRRLEGFVVESACGQVSNPTTSDECKDQLFIPCLERMTQELTERFSDVAEELMPGVQACNPTSQTFLFDESLKSLASH